ncbi:hypothetical protein GOP47_0003701 [Adiantum capillus-veneris]|uniref:BRO1 domain-containing protein n=1 Tax=Adiantum capillus-veneris TaxID=13818 RepID=A0A9D4V6F7_ADICA|nr:hypothetical protein GOP47_0003701 [Adiantum capillus-veneris]
MGCLLSSARNDGDAQDEAQLVLPIVVFFPGLRSPSQTIDFSGRLGGLASPHSIQQLLACQSHVITLTLAVEEEATSRATKQSSGWKSATQHDGNNVADLQQALADYLLVLLSLAKEDSKLVHSVAFAWKNQEDSQLETSISDVHYEVLSVLHAMAVLGLFQANLLLASTGYQATTSEERTKRAIDIFLKVSGILECAMKFIIPEFSQESRAKLPVDLKEDVLHALSMQALGQVVEIQLGLAIDNMKATLAVKRRLACEQVKYLQKAHENLSALNAGGLWGGKHCLFVNWKLAEAKAAAFYFHGLILDEGSEDGTHAKAVLCLKTANGYLKESQKLSQSFCSASPTTRPAPVWGAMKYLSERIPREFSSKARSYRDVVHREKPLSQVPELPDFPLSLHPEEFKLPQKIDDLKPLD